MKLSLTSKLTIAFLLVALTATILVALIMRLYSTEQLNRLVIEQQRDQFAETLLDYYQSSGSWEGLFELIGAGSGDAALRQGLPGRGELPANKPERRFGPHITRRWEFFGLADAEGVVVIPVSPQTPPGSLAPAGMLAEGVPLEIEGERIGTILTVLNPPDFTPAEQAFLRRTNSALWIAAILAAGLALLVGLLLARTLTSPLRQLTTAAESITRGELEQQVDVRTGDEIEALGEAFNQMSRAIARANQQRRQMTADIAHDLRTPLTVIGGYIESMRAGVLKPTRERLDLVYSEIERLEGLVGDLGVLARADAGELCLNLSPVNPAALLENAAGTFQLAAGQKNIELQIQAEPGLPLIKTDESRMAQVFSNLVSNALRYTPPGGRILLGARQEGRALVLSVADDGPGIDPDDLPYIFNRFYRADRARSERNGESGLGLAICKALVEAQGGTITVESTPGEGTRFLIRFPVLEKS